MQKNNIRKTKLGFTMMELLGAVAILVVLFAVSAPAVNAIKERLAWNKANGIAKEIYMVAQNQAVHMRSNNALDSFQNSVYGTDSNPGACYTQKISTKPADYTKSNQKYKNLYYIAGNQSDPVSYIIPNITQQTITGSYLVEINPNSGDVYGVFYSDTMTASELVAAYEAGMTNEDTIRPKENRKEDKIGYYGGYGDAGLSGETNTINIEVHNDEQLYVKVNVPDANYDDAFSKTGTTGDINFSMDFVISDEHGNKIIRSGSTANLANTDINKPIFTRNKKNSSVDAYLILDDYINSTSNTFKDINKGLTPGDDITIYAQACYISSDSKYLTSQLYGSTNSVTANSLFADGTNIVTTAAKKNDGSYKTSVVKIANCRHLYNLRNFRADAEWAKSNEGREIRTNQKVIFDQTDDIDFAKLSSTKTEVAGICPVFRINGSVDTSDGVDDCSLSFNAKSTYDNITNYYLFGTNSNNWTGSAGDGFSYSNPNNTYDGHGNEIQNLIISSSAATGSGLFGKFNAVVKDVHIRNIRVTSSSTRSDGRRYVGGLVGWGGSKTKISDCGVYCTAYKEKDKYSYNTSKYSSFDYSNYYIEGRADVGGLVGRVENGASVTDSFAAIDVRVENGLTAEQIQAGSVSCNSFGGLIGRVTANSAGDSCSTVVKNCYSSGKVTGTFDIGGLIGVCYGSVSNCYTTSIVKPTFRYVTEIGSSYIAGGIIGKLQKPGKVDSCNFYGSFEKLDSSVDWKSENIGLILDRSRAKALSSRVTNCKFLVMNGYNDDLSERVTDTAESAYACGTECTSDDESITADNSASKSFGYKSELADKAFPFKFISNIGYHYGDWTTVKSVHYDPTFVYYEKYTKAGYPDIVRFYTNGSSKLPSLLSQSDMDKKGSFAGYSVNKAGYAIVASKQKEINLSNAAIQSDYFYEDPEGNYKVFDLTATYQNKERGSNFYDSLLLNGTTWYYNPNVAKAISKTNSTPSSVIIRTAKQLTSLGKNSYYWNKSGTSFTFNQELDVNYVTYGETLQNSTIGNSDTPFIHTYNGCDYDIIGYSLTFVPPTSAKDYNYIGLFGYAKNATIKNVHMVSSGNSKISVTYPNKKYKGKNYKFTRTTVGGLVGYQQSGTISNCSISEYEIVALPEINDNAYSLCYMGGLVGTSTGAITNCTAVNKELKALPYKATNNGKSFVLAGLVGVQLTGGSISNCYSGGNIKYNVTNSQIDDVVFGGLVGVAYRIGTSSVIYAEIVSDYPSSEAGGTISNSYSFNKFESNAPSGDMVVYGVSAIKSANISNSYYCKDTSAISGINDTSLGKTTAELASVNFGSAYGSAASADMLMYYNGTVRVFGNKYTLKPVIKLGGSYVHYGVNVDGSTGPEPTPEPTEEQDAPPAPTIASITANKITLVPITGGHGATQYAMSTSNTAPTDGWQTSVVFDGLTGGTDYYFFARYSGDDEYKQSPPSPGTKGTTPKADQPAPPAPTAENVTKTSITLNTITGGHGSVEYAMSTSSTAPTEGWQTSTQFTDLTANTGYYFFARYTGDEHYNASPASSGTLITTAKDEQDPPAAPTIKTNKTGTEIELNAITTTGHGEIQYAYSTTNTAPTDGWQTSTRFTGLTPATQYYFFARYAGDEEYGPAVSTGTPATTPKANQTAPSAPTIATETPNIGTVTVTLNAITTSGHGTIEYAVSTSSTAPSTGWQTTLDFSGLKPKQTYYFFARYTGDDQYNVATSTGRLYTTGKANQNAPSAPTKLSATSTSITVNAVAAGQGDTLYAISTTDAAPTSGWSTSTTFTGLYASTTYYVFAKYEGNDKYNPSLVSDAGIISTLFMNYVGSVKIYGKDGEAYAYLQFYTVDSNGTINHTLQTRKIPRGTEEYNSIVGPKLKDDTLKYAADTYYFFWNVEDNSKWKYKKRVGSESNLPSNNYYDLTTSIGNVTYKYNGTQVGSTIKW